MKNKAPSANEGFFNKVYEFIACVTFACCLVGHAVGRRFGALLGSKAQVLGGVILIVLGAKILIEHLSGG